MFQNTLLNVFRRDLREYDRRLDHACRVRLGVTVKIYKSIKYLVELGALVLAGYSIESGADPTTALMLAAFIISGPELFEFLVVRDSGDFDTSDD